MEGNGKVNIKAAQTVSYEDIPKSNMGTQTIDLNEKQAKSGEKTTLDFMNSNYVNEFVGKKTKRAEDNVQETSGEFSGKTTEQVRQEINAAESSKEDWTPDDFKMVAEFIITIIDSVIASGLRWWSKDTSDQAYSLSKDKQSKLVKQLTMMLIKYQAKFRIEIIFLLSIIMFYAGPFLKARDRRKLIKEDEQRTSEQEQIRQNEIAAQILEKETKAGLSKAEPNIVTPEIIDDGSGNLTQSVTKIKRPPSLKRNVGKQPK